MFFLNFLLIKIWSFSVCMIVNCKMVRGFYGLALVSTMIACNFSTTNGEKEPKEIAKPNIVLITADDLGTQLGCYGDSLAKTPFLDSLASHSIKFANAYVTQASCSPSRGSILTGLYPHQNGQVGSAGRGFSALPGLANLPSFLRKNGYRTAILGKLHVKPEEDFNFDFKVGNVRKTRDVQWVSDTLATFIHNTDQPFFAYINYFDPHVTGTNGFLSQVKGIPSRPYSEKEVKPFPFQGIGIDGQLEKIAGYYNSISRLDEGIRRFMVGLKKQNQAKNTLFIFIGDHGPPFSRAKASCYEAGVKVPLLIHWPQVIKEGIEVHELVSSLDIFPTILELHGKQNEQDLAGRSLYPILTGQKPRDWRDYLFTEFTFHGDQHYFPRRTIRDRRYKLIQNPKEGNNPINGIDGDRAYELSQHEAYKGTKVREIFDRLNNPPEFELYDLKNDPWELENLSELSEYDSIQTHLQAELKEWQKQTNDTLNQIK